MKFSRHFNFANFANFPKSRNKVPRKKKQCRQNLLTRNLSDVLLNIKWRSVATFVKRYLDWFLPHSLIKKTWFWNFIKVVQIVGRVDFIVFFRQIPVNKLLFDTKTRIKSRYFFYEIAKIKWLQFYNLTIFPQSLSVIRSEPQNWRDAWSNNPWKLCYTPFFENFEVVGSENAKFLLHYRYQFWRTLKTQEGGPTVSPFRNHDAIPKLCDVATSSSHSPPTPSLGRNIQLGGGSGGGGGGKMYPIQAAFYQEYLRDRRLPPPEKKKKSLIR